MNEQDSYSMFGNVSGPPSSSRYWSHRSSLYSANPFLSMILLVKGLVHMTLAPEQQRCLEPCCRISKTFLKQSLSKENENKDVFCAKLRRKGVNIMEMCNIFERSINVSWNQHDIPYISFKSLLHLQHSVRELRRNPPPPEVVVDCQAGQVQDASSSLRLRVFLEECPRPAADGLDVQG